MDGLRTFRFEKTRMYNTGASKICSYYHLGSVDDKGLSMSPIFEGWAKKNLSGHFYIEEEPYHIMIIFSREEDALLFKLGFL